MQAAADALEDVRITGDALKITPLKAITPEEAEDAARRLYAMAPNARITDHGKDSSGILTHRCRSAESALWAATVPRGAVH